MLAGTAISYRYSGSGGGCRFLALLIAPLAQFSFSIRPAKYYSIESSQTPHIHLSESVLIQSIGVQDCRSRNNIANVFLSTIQYGFWNAQSEFHDCCKGALLFFQFFTFSLMT